MSKRKDFYSDSSDEEEISKQNREFDLKTSNVDFNALSKQLDIHPSKVIKSYLLHNIGRMVIYSPEVERKYRKHKQIHLAEKSSHLDKKARIDTKELVGDIVGLEDLIAIGRLLKRSQVRLYKEVYKTEQNKHRSDRNYKHEERVNADITMASRNKRQSSVVKENLVVNYNGLGGSRFPNTDMVNLQGESKRGDYTSAYRDSENSYGKSSVDQLIEAGNSTAVQLEESDDLEQAIKTISELKETIAKNYPRLNSDIFIAESIRKVCKAESLSKGLESGIVNQIYALTYLLFKTEVYRSPAALTNHMQMLDLIINEEMTLKNAFEENVMPMSPSGAVKAARQLEEIYENSGDIFYQYESPYNYAPGYEDKFTPKMLIHKESELMDKWLKFKLGEDKFAEVNANLEQHLPEIFREIYQTLQVFGLNIHSKAFYKAMEDLPPQKDRELNSSIGEIALAQNEIIDFNQEATAGSFTKNDVIDAYNSCFDESNQIKKEELIKKHSEKSERNLSDDERFICLWMECDKNARLSFKPDFTEGFAEIKKGQKLLAICPIQSISTDHGGYSDTIREFIENHKDKEAKIIFSIHGNNHYTTLVVDPTTMEYRYVNPMKDSKKGEIEDNFLKQALESLNYKVCNRGYKKQQYSEKMSKTNDGVLTHNNECAFHNVFTTIRIAQSNTIKANLEKMDKFGMKMLQTSRVTLTPEFARDNLRPFYEEVFEALRNKIKTKQEIGHNADLSPSSSPITPQSVEKLSPITEQKKK